MRIFPALACFMACFLACGCLSIEQPVIGQDPSPPSRRASYRIKLVAYGKTYKVPKKGAKKRQKPRVKRVWASYLLEGDGKKILIDPGVSTTRSSRKHHIDDYIRPDKALAEVGIEPREITHVLLTHYHDTAIEGVTLFPSATFYIQAGALAYARSFVARGTASKNGVSERTVRYLERMLDREQLVLMDSSSEVLPGIDAHVSWTHVRWNQYFVVNTRRGPWVITSDLVPFYNTLKRRRSAPEREKKSRSDYSLELDNIWTLAGGKRRILPGYSRRVVKIHPKITDHVHMVTGHPKRSRKKSRKR